MAVIALLVDDLFESAAVEKSPEARVGAVEPGPQVQAPPREPGHRIGGRARGPDQTEVAAHGQTVTQTTCPSGRSQSVNKSPPKLNHHGS
jgi:hypothetical protein